MYKRILTTVNEHLNSEVTARYALNLARVCGAKLYLCFVAEKEMTAPTINRAEEAVKRIFLEAEKIGIEIEAITETGDPVRKIGELVRGERIDIVFASTRKEDIERRFLRALLQDAFLSAFPVQWLSSGWCTQAGYVREKYSYLSRRGLTVLKKGHILRQRSRRHSAQKFLYFTLRKQYQNFFMEKFI